MVVLIFFFLKFLTFEFMKLSSLVQFPVICKEVGIFLLDHWGKSENIWQLSYWFFFLQKLILPVSWSYLFVPTANLGIVFYHVYYFQCFELGISSTIV